MTIKQCKFRMLYCHYTLSFPNNWKWEMLYEKQNIQWKHYITVLKLFKVYSTTQDHYSLWDYCIFIPKFTATTKNLETNYTFLVNQECEGAKEWITHQFSYAMRHNDANNIAPTPWSLLRFKIFNKIDSFLKKCFNWPWRKKGRLHLWRGA